MSCGAGCFLSQKSRAQEGTILDSECGLARGVAEAGTDALLLRSSDPPSTFTSLVYLEDTISKPLELPCTPTCNSFVFSIDNATIVWL